MITEILRKYGAGEITAEEANEQLRAAGAGFSVDPDKGCPHGCWSKAEMREGFFDNPDDEKTPVLPKTPDMKRRKELAGMTVAQHTAAGVFAVTYNENGYAVKAARV